MKNHRYAIFLALAAPAFIGCSQATNEQLSASLAPYAISLASAGFMWVSAWGARWLAAHTKNANVKAGIERLDDAVNTTVRAIEQTTVASIKTRTTGKLSADEGKVILNEAIKSVKDHFGPKDLAALAKNLGVDDLTDLVRVRIEASVQDLRASAPATAPAPAAIARS